MPLHRRSKPVNRGRYRELSYPSRLLAGDEARMVDHPWRKRCDKPATDKDDDRSVPAVDQKKASEKRRHREEEAKVMREGGEQRRHCEHNE